MKKTSVEHAIWNGSQPTGSELGIDTPLPYLDDSWRVAVRLLDKGRRLYREGKGLDAAPDRTGGYPGAWLPVSLGRRCPMASVWDERDIRHAAKMIAYLWAEEPGLVQEYEKNLEGFRLDAQRLARLNEQQLALVNLNVRESENK